MANAEPVKRPIEPLKLSITVKRAPAEAFEIFTSRYGAWWPYQKFSVHRADTRECVFEARLGGEIYEVAKSGERVVWGRVVVWEPPHRFVMSWYPGRGPETGQEVEVRFVAVEEGTRVELEHRDWEKLGAIAREERTNYENGWAVVFAQRFAEACK
ncbi:MAG: SRPBCC domain-containing protein [Candidatus Latescibacteria bacterium]|nr:SRPBCC domain-containing protein [Candidatus Latescibacterota bacterium]